jgi:hypothetical protein
MASIVLDLENRFTYHAPKEGQPETYTHIRAEIRDLAFTLVALTPQSREQSLMLTHLEEVMFWANAAVARNT